MEIALKNNFQIQQAENNLEVSEANVFASKMNLFTPDLNGNLRFGQTQGRQFNNVTGTIIDQITTSSSGGINASFTLFDGFRNINTLRNANSNKVSQQERLKRAKEDLIFNVASQYLAILLDNQLLSISKENLLSSNAQLNLIKAQVEVGSRPVADLYNQESIVSNNELTILQRENTLNNDKLRLIRILQIDPTKDYQFEIPQISSVSSIKQLDFNDLLSKAINNRSDLKAQVALIESNRLNYKSSIGQHYPTISLSAGLNTNYNDRFIEPIFDANNTVIGTQKVAFGDQFFDRNRNLSFSLNIQIPIYNQFSVRNSVVRSKISYKNSVLDLDNQKLAVIQEVRQAYNDYLSFAKQLEAAEKTLTFAKKSLETQQERYNIGASTLIELAQANAQFVEASSNRAQSQFRLIFQEQLINYYVGKINPDFTLN